MKVLQMLSVGELEQRGEAALQTGPFGTQLKASEYTPEGTPVINVRNIGFGSLREDHLEYVPEGKAAKLWQHHLKTGDIVFGRKGAVERHALINKHSNGWIQGSDCMRLRITSSTVCEKYLSYYLRTAAHQDWMQALCSFGATMSSLNQDILRRLTFPAPPLATQQKIAAILSAYDDLIANNQRRITLLERMAEDIYREWFVRLRFPGHEHVPAQKGIPQGWALVSIASLGAYLNGYAFDPTQWFSAGIPIIKIKEMTSGVTADTPRNPGESIQKRYHFGNGEIIFSWSATLLVKIWDQGPGLLNQHLFKVSPNQDIPKSFLFFSIKFSLPTFEALTTGSTMKHIKRKELETVKVLQPPLSLLEQFDSVASPLLTQMLDLTRANRNLAATRDALLPRLISGKLAVDGLDIRFPPEMAPSAP